MNAAAFAASVALLLVFPLVQIVPSSEVASARISSVLFLFPLALALIECYRASAVAQGRERRMWRLLSLSAGAFLVAMTYRMIHVFLHNSFPEAGSFEDVANVAGFLLLAPMVLAFIEPHDVAGFRRIRNILDLMTMVLATFVVAYLLLILPFGEASSRNSPLENFLAVSYTVAAASTVMHLITFKRERWLIWERSILAAAVSIAIGMGVMAALIPYDLYEAGTTETGVVNGLWACGGALVAVAGHLRVSNVETARRGPRRVFDPPHWPAMVAMSVALIGIPLLVLISPELQDRASRLVISSSASLIAALAIGRSAVVSLENRELARLVPVDPLTGLWNLGSLCRDLESEASTLPEAAELTLVMFDVDGFSDLNRRLGYAKGDLVIRRIALEMQELEDECVTAYRVGGDDFALLLSSGGPVEAYEIASRISDAVSSSFADTPGVELSIGIAVYPMHTSDPMELTRVAEGAAYHAKTLGGSQIVVYDPQVVDVLDHHQHIAKLENRTHTTMVESLAAAVDARDPYTQYHSRNVAQLVAFLCRELGMPEERVSLLHSAALLHDVGKIGVPDSVLKKEGPLNEEERQMIQTHPDLGVEILHASVRQEILPWVHAHHERPDGRGYPKGLTADEIPFEAKLLSVCDAFDAMTTDRPYRRGLSIDEAIAELRRCSGTQLDSDLVEVFIVLVGAGRASDVVLEPSHPRLRISS